MRKNSAPSTRNGYNISMTVYRIYISLDQAQKPGDKNLSSI